MLSYTRAAGFPPCLSTAAACRACRAARPAIHAGLGTLRTSDDAEFNKARATPYAYWHSYAPAERRRRAAVRDASLLVDGFWT